jgi:plastocyanin
MKIIILGLIITASILILYASISDMMNFEIQNTDNELIDSIYSEKEIFTEAPYSGNTNDKAQHVIIIVKDSWKQGCEVDDSCFLPYEKIIGVGETILFLNQDEFEHNVRLRGDPNYLHFPTDVIKQNEYFVYKFHELGKYQYHCTLHPWMEGMITIR